MRWGSGGLAGADLAQRRAGLAEGLLPPALPPVSISKRSLAPGRNWRDWGRPEAVDRVRQARFHRCNGTPFPTVRCSAVQCGVGRCEEGR